MLGPRPNPAGGMGGWEGTPWLGLNGRGMPGPPGAATATGARGGAKPEGMPSGGTPGDGVGPGGGITGMSLP